MKQNENEPDDYRRWKVVYNNLECKKSWEQWDKLLQIIAKVLTERKWCWMYGGIGRVFTTSSFRKIKHSIWTNTVVNKLKQTFHQNLQTRKVLCSTKITHLVDHPKKISEPGWEILSHPSYSPDIAPTDYHLFRLLQNSTIKVSILWRTAEDTSATFSSGNLTSFGRMESSGYLKDDKR